MPAVHCDENIYRLSVLLGMSQCTMVISQEWRQQLYFSGRKRKIEEEEEEEEEERERERERQRETERDRERQRETERDRDRDRDSERERQTDRQTDRQRQTETDRQTDRQTETQRQRHRDRENPHCMTAVNMVGKNPNFELIEREKSWWERGDGVKGVGGGRDKAGQDKISVL